MRIYETVYICPPNLDEERLEDFCDLIREVIYDNGGKIIKQEKWGKRRLAYTIHRFNEGVYFYFLYGGEKVNVDEVERRLRLAEECIRFLTVRLDLELKGKKHKIFTQEELRLALQMEPEKKPHRSRRKPEESAAETTAEGAAEAPAEAAPAEDAASETPEPAPVAEAPAAEATEEQAQ